MASQSMLLFLVFGYTLVVHAHNAPLATKEVQTLQQEDRQDDGQQANVTSFGHAQAVLPGQEGDDKPASQEAGGVAYSRAFRKVIWILWFQGWDKAPWLQKMCLESWQKLNPGWTVVQLDQTNIVEHWPDFDLFQKKIDSKERDYGQAALSDILRVHLLQKHGGVWVDSTLVCTQPLDAWLPADLQPSGFWSYHANQGLTTWFIASEAGNALASTWAAAVDKYWESHTKPDEYLWAHFLFVDLVKKDAACVELWKNVPVQEVSHEQDGPETINKFGIWTKEVSPEVRERVDAGVKGRMYKLSSVIMPSSFEAAAGSNGHYLLQKVASYSKDVQPA